MDTMDPMDLEDAMDMPSTPRATIVKFRNAQLNWGHMFDREDKAKFYKGTYWVHVSGCPHTKKKLDVTLTWQNEIDNSSATYDTPYVMAPPDNNHELGDVVNIDIFFVAGDEARDRSFFLTTEDSMCSESERGSKTSWMAVKLEEVLSPLVLLQHTFTWQPATACSGLVDLSQPSYMIGQFRVNAL